MNNPNPEHSPAVCPYLMVENAEDQMSFLVNVFDAVITDDTRNNEGIIQHGEVRLHNSVIMMATASKAFPARQSMNYVYVHDADKTYEKALQHGASPIMEPADRAYGVREGGFTDSYGNQWWVAQLLNTK